MNLSIDNFAIINHADIKVDGITVIAGSNNSGKSTVGKILFSIYQSLRNIDEKVKGQKIASIHQELLQTHDIFAGKKLFPEEVLNNFLGEVSFNKNNLDGTLAQRLLSEDFLGDIPASALRIIEETKKNIHNILEWPADMVGNEIIDSVFSRVFKKQINSLHTDKETSDVYLEIENKKNHLYFYRNFSTLASRKFDITNNVFYIETPDILNEVNNFSSLPLTNTDLTHAVLIDYLSSYEYKSTNPDTALTRSMNKEKLKDIYQLLNGIVPGEVRRVGAQYALSQEGFAKPINLSNLSMGLKAFTVIKMLLESNVMEHGDLLILDEPEIHLHPTWQITYAEILILLQKFFDLKIVITTHSHFFLKAIDTYTQKYGVRDKAHYYLSEPDKEQKLGVTIKEVSDEPDAIYAKMAEAVHTLRDLQTQL